MISDLQKIINYIKVDSEIMIPYQIMWCSILPRKDIQSITYTQKVEKIRDLFSGLSDFSFFWFESYEITVTTFL